MRVVMMRKTRKALFGIGIGIFVLVCLLYIFSATRPTEPTWNRTNTTGEQLILTMLSEDIDTALTDKYGTGMRQYSLETGRVAVAGGDTFGQYEVTVEIQSIPLSGGEGTTENMRFKVMLGAPNTLLEISGKFS